MKNNFFKSLVSKWLYYLLAIFASIAVSFLSIIISSKPKRREVVSIFLTSYGIEPELKLYLDDYKDDYLDSIQLTNYSIDHRNYINYLEGFKYKMDILIIPESKLETFHTFTFLKLTDEFINEIAPNGAEYYDFDNIHCGLKIYSNTTNTGILDNMIHYTKEDINENYYMFINKNSLHLGNYNDSKYSGAINVLKGMFSYA